MANVDYLVIRIEGESSISKKDSSQDEDTFVEDLAKALSSLEKKRLKNVDKIFATVTKNAATMASKSLKQVYQVSENALTMGWNRYTTLQEDYLAENKINNIKQAIGKTKSLATSISTGATTGSVMGIPGAVIGGVAGAVTWGVKEYQQNQQKLSQYYQQLNETNFQTYLDSSRAGLVNNGRGTEN